MILWKILLVSAVILLVNRMLRTGSITTGRTSTGRPRESRSAGSQSSRGRSSASRSWTDYSRKTIPHGETGGGAVERVQCPWCHSWNVTQFRDLRGAYWFLILLTFGLILLFTPVFPRVNVCSDCGRRWSFGDRR